MLVSAIIVAVIVVLVFGWMVLSSSRLASRAMAQASERTRHPERDASESSARLEPESRFIVRLSESELVCERPDGRIERVGWSELQKVEVVTTNDGPMVPDVFWLLHGAKGGCAIPQGATGERDLLERLQALPGFDNAKLIEAMGSTADERFLCWQRK